MGTERKPGHFTFRAAAALLAISAALEVLAIASEVPLLGGIRGGVAAGIYHASYAVLFLALAWGLWTAAKWAYPLVFVAAAVYTLDKLQMILFRAAMEAFVKSQMVEMEGELLAQGVDETLVMQTMTLLAVVSVVCWWGFALYAYRRRDYFRGQS